MLWIKQFNIVGLCWYPQCGITSNLFIHSRQRIPPSVFSPWELLLPPNTPSWSSFNSEQGHITHSHTRAQRGRRGKQGANGWVIGRDNSLKGLRYVWSLRSRERTHTHTAVYAALCCSRKIHLVHNRVETLLYMTAIRIRNTNALEYHEAYCGSGASLVRGPVYLH